MRTKFSQPGFGRALGAVLYNVIVLGPPGVGKTHLAASLGLKAIGNG